MELDQIYCTNCNKMPIITNLLPFFSFFLQFSSSPDCNWVTINYSMIIECFLWPGEHQEPGAGRHLRVRVQDCGGHVAGPGRGAEEKL